MAIIYTNEAGETVVEYQDAVLGLEGGYPTGSRAIRVFFSVWGTQWYTNVWDRESATICEIEVAHSEAAGPGKKVVVDASDEVLVEVEWYKKGGSRTVFAFREGGEEGALAELAVIEQEDAERAAQRAEEEAERYCNMVRQGARVVVARGRQVPGGTDGLLFWEREGQWGTRIGIRDDEGEKHWTYLKNVEAVTSKPEGMTWLDYQRTLENEQVERTNALPQKGEMVCVLVGERIGEVGEIFWAKEGRIGIGFGDKPTRGPWNDVAWLSSDEVEVKPRA